MNKLLKLRQRLHDLKAKGRGVLEAVQALAAKDDPADDDATKIATLNTEADEIEAQIDAVETEIEDETARADREHALAAAFAPATTETLRPSVIIRSDEPDPAAMCGFSDNADFARAVHAACVPGAGVEDPRLLAVQAAAIMAAPTNFHQESGADEGYMVPPAMRDEIFQLIFAGQDVLNMITLEPTSGNAVTFIRDESTPWGATGIQAKWAGEGTVLTATKLETKAEMARLHKLYAFVLATDELLEDAPRLNARLTKGASEAILYKASDSIVYGTGVGQPLGYFVSAAGLSVAKETSQVADTIVTANVLKMYSRLLVMGTARPFWLANRDTVPQLGVMTIGNQPVWTPPNAGLAQAPGGFLLGYPIQFSEHAKTVGDKGDIQLVNPAGYFGLEKRGGIQFATSMHLFFDFGIGAFRWTFRLGGQPFLSTPVVADNGGTKSHFVVLDERV